jgi:hypothetical protein
LVADVIVAEDLNKWIEGRDIFCHRYQKFKPPNSRTFT